jgi:hypothetical protein
VTGTTLSEAAASSRLRLRTVLHPLHPTQEDGSSSRLPQGAVKVSPLVLKCRWWNSSHPVPNRLTQHPLPHWVALHSRGSPISSRNFPMSPALCLLTTASALQTGEPRPRAVLKSIILFIDEYSCAAYDNRGNGLAAGLLGRRWCSRQKAGIGTVPQ